MKVLFPKENKEYKELQVLKHISLAQAPLTGRFNICTLLDDFVFSNSGSSYHCLILEAMGPTVQEICMALSGPFSAPLHRRFCRQVLSGCLI